LEIPLPVDTDLLTVIALLRELTVSAVPLVGIGAVSALSLLRAAGAAQDEPSSVEIGAPAHLMYTDVGHVTALDDAPWGGTGERSYTGLLDPDSPVSITVLNSRIGAARNLSISFHDDVYDRRVIEGAARYLTDPIRFLVP